MRQCFSVTTFSCVSDLRTKANGRKNTFIYIFCLRLVSCLTTESEGLWENGKKKNKYVATTHIKNALHRIWLFKDNSYKTDNAFAHNLETEFRYIDQNIDLLEFQIKGKNKMVRIKGKSHPKEYRQIILTDRFPYVLLQVSPRERFIQKNYEN